MIAKLIPEEVQLGKPINKNVLSAVFGVLLKNEWGQMRCVKILVDRLFGDFGPIC
jgi:hypothetical protein